MPHNPTGLVSPDDPLILEFPLLAAYSLDGSLDELQFTVAGPEEAAAPLYAFLIAELYRKLAIKFDVTVEALQEWTQKELDHRTSQDLEPDELPRKH